MNNSTSVLANSLKYGAILTLAIVVVGGVLGYLIAGTGGLFSALVGAVLAAIFMGFNAASMIVATRVTRDRPSTTVYFGIVLGAWFLKLVLFLVVLISLRGQHWLNPYAFFLAVVTAVIGSIITDIVAFARTRVPYVGDIELPGQSASADAQNGDN
jgi:drug/metabolite transporter (DMT)-like permease